MAANDVFYLPGAVLSENWAQFIFSAAFADILRQTYP
jgi:hypothetical protein